MLRPEANQYGWEDGVRVLGDDPIGVAHRVDGSATRVLQDAADVPQALVRRVISGVPFAFLGCGCNAVGMSFLELVAVGGEERCQVGISWVRLWCAGVL